STHQGLSCVEADKLAHALQPTPSTDTLLARGLAQDILKLRRPGPALPGPARSFFEVLGPAPPG
ncbi:MAG: hypothetical protein ABJC87_15120, partial [Roseobacter sp.]